MNAEQHMTWIGSRKVSYVVDKLRLRPFQVRRGEFWLISEVVQPFFGWTVMMESCPLFLLEPVEQDLHVFPFSARAVVPFHSAAVSPWLTGKGVFNAFLWGENTVKELEKICDWKCKEKSIDKSKS